MKKLNIVIVGTCLRGDIAMSQEICVSADGLSFTSGGMIYYFLAISIVLKSLSWGLGLIADKTETKWDNKIAKWLGRAGAAIAWVIGLFGFGNTPRSVKFISFKGDNNGTKTRD